MPISLAILGLAHSHVGVYCDQWLSMPDQPIRITSAWDHDADRLTMAAAKYGCNPCNSPATAMAGCNAVIIGAETSMHADLVELAAPAGNPIILQKPLALTLEQAERIVAAVAKHEAPFTLAWQMRVDPQNLEMKRLIQSGAIGRVYMVRRRHGLSTHTWSGFEGTWHVKPELNRGMWADDASHAIDFLLWLLGKPQSVVAEIDTLRSPKVPDDHGIAIFRYVDGTFAEVVSSFTCLAGENTTEIVGEDGVIIQNYGDAPSSSVPRPKDAAGLKWFLKGASDWRISPIPTPDNHRRRIEALAPELLGFLRGQRGPIATAQEGRTALAMTVACYDAAATGRRVQIA
ncbi:MAG TPA: Gfo/Idh/MocA family oxidoreductase [Tepidisphaeraceae bacterium]|nr:Gfo/Idh/MocA family oxidoreductase [Tepidisphaeraceae bacterium]